MKLTIISSPNQNFDGNFFNLFKQFGIGKNSIVFVGNHIDSTSLAAKVVESKCELVISYNLTADMAGLYEQKIAAKLPAVKFVHVAARYVKKNTTTSLRSASCKTFDDIPNEIVKLFPQFQKNLEQTQAAA